MEPLSISVGILEIQGGFSEHRVALQKAAQELAIEPKLKIISVRKATDISSSLSGLIIPGGESTTMGLFISRNNMAASLQEWIQDGKHVTWGTCAGLIMLANETEKQKIGGQPLVSTDVENLKLLKVKVNTKENQNLSTKQYIFCNFNTVLA